MKVLITVVMCFIGTTTFAGTQAIDCSTAIEISADKKSRKKNRIKNKRRKACHRAAIRNYAG